jgi:UDP-glucuronate 4-epimerase
MKVLVTGAAGFIGSAVSLRLLAHGHEVVGIDNLSDYYDVKLKRARLERNKAYTGYTDLRVDIADREGVRILHRHTTRCKGPEAQHWVAQQLLITPAN